MLNIVLANLVLFAGAGAVVPTDSKLRLRGDIEHEVERQLESQPKCPLRPCVNPCPANKCAGDEVCVTRPTQYSPGCPGCRVFKRCRKKRQPTCPAKPMCSNPCRGCQGAGKVCVTEPTQIRPGCPGCRKFVRCEKVECPQIQCPDWPPCPAGRCKRNETCVIRDNLISPGCPGCPEFIRCKQRETCGNTTCPENQVCCNPSCGICTPPGGGCTYQLCVP